MSTIPRTPVDAYRARLRRRRWLVIVTVALLAGVGCAVFNNANRRNVPVEYANDVEHFKYGSIGSDATGLPYWIWRAMPVVCPDKLPGGYPALGLVQETGMDRPVGFSKRRTGPFDRVGPNCAFCHTATVRATRDGERQVYLAAPAHQFDILRYFTFLFECGADERFTEANVMSAIDGMTHLGPVERFIYRRAIAPTRDALRAQSEKIAWVRTRPPWGPGRVDTFNPYKTLIFDLDMSHDDTIGTADFMTIWNEADRDGLWLHWDGNNDSIDERNLSAATGAGATPENIDLSRIERVRRWIWNLKAPSYPFPIDGARAERGKAIYDGKGGCAACHDFRGARIGEVIPLEYIGTDPERTQSFDPQLAKRMNSIGTGYPWRFRRFRPTHGYVNQPLDGAWLRAPYLHNGSVPTLRDLLKPPGERPTAFYKGDDVYDPVNVGFVGDQSGEGGKPYFAFNTADRGNHNSGHTYGTTLRDDEKDALIEYLKTL